MGLFSTNYSYLGVDLGSSSVKLVELGDDKGVPRLSTYGFTEQSVDIVKDDSDAARAEIANILKKLVKESKATGNKVITALPTYSVFSSIISLPAMSAKDIASAVRWEAKKIVPMPIDDVVLKWNVVETRKLGSKAVNLKGFMGGGGVSDIKSTVNNIAPSKLPDNLKKNNTEEKEQDLKILLTAAPKQLVGKYMDIFQRAGLNLVSLETEIFALIRSLVGNDRSTLLLVDIGAKSTNISLVQGGIAIINRSIELGGMNITDEISRNLNISRERAEQFKHDIGINIGDQADSSVFKSIEGVVVPIVDEIKYTMDFFSEQLDLGHNLEQEKIEKIILTGGSSLLSYLPEYLSQKLDKKVYIGDPWARVVYPTELRPIFEEIGPKLSVSIGLAMREIV